MEDTSAPSEVVNTVSVRTGGFSLFKGIILLCSATLIGFVLSYELITSSGDYLGIHDFIQKGALKLTDRDVNRRSHDTSVTPTSSVPVTSSVLTTGETFSTQKPEMSTQNSTAIQFSDYNLTNGTNTTGTPVEVTTLMPTTTLEPCFREGYKLKQSCDIPPYVNETYGGDVTLEMIGHMLFKTELLDLLDDRCGAGDWCLDDDWLIVSDGNDFLDFCYAATCLRDNIADECLDEKRRLIVGTLLLLCDDSVATYNISDADQCYIALRKMTHVSMSLVTRRPRVEQTCDVITTPGVDNCTDTCQKFARGLYCMCEICDHELQLYEEYSDWQWYFRNDDITDTCNLSNETTCYYLMSPEESWFNDFWNKLKTTEVTSDSRVLTGVIVGTIVMVVCMAVSVWACVRKGSVFRRHGRDRVEYTQVGEDEDEFDDTA